MKTFIALVFLAVAVGGASAAEFSDLQNFQASAAKAGTQSFPFGDGAFIAKCIPAEGAAVKSAPDMGPLFSARTKAALDTPKAGYQVLKEMFDTGYRLSPELMKGEFDGRTFYMDDKTNENIYTGAGLKSDEYESSNAGPLFSVKRLAVEVTHEHAGTYSLGNVRDNRRMEYVLWNGDEVSFRLAASGGYIIEKRVQKDPGTFNALFNAEFAKVNYSYYWKK